MVRIANEPDRSQCRSTHADDRDAAGINIEDSPKLKAWVDRIFARPAVQRGLNVPEENRAMKALQELWLHGSACPLPQRAV